MASAAKTIQRFRDTRHILSVLLRRRNVTVGRNGRDRRLSVPALALGLTGRMTATIPGDQLRHDLVALAEQIGQPDPHGEIHSPAEERRQSHLKHPDPVVATTLTLLGTMLAVLGGIVTIFGVAIPRVESWPVHASAEICSSP